MCVGEDRRPGSARATTAGLDPDRIEDLQLALGEATRNAVEHAHLDAPTPSRVPMDIDFDDNDALTVSVTDTGTWRPAPADLGYRGRGLQIISAIGCDVVLDAGPTGTAVRFRLDPAPHPGTGAGFAAIVPPGRAVPAPAFPLDRQQSPVQRGPIMQAPWWDEHTDEGGGVPVGWRSCCSCPAAGRVWPYRSG